MSETNTLTRINKLVRKSLSLESNSALTGLSNLANIFQILLTCRNLNKMSFELPKQYVCAHMLKHTN